MEKVDFESVLTLALQLTPRERLQLVERVVSSVEPTLPVETAPTEGHWGQNLVALLNTLDLSDWAQADPSSNS